MIPASPERRPTTAPDPGRHRRGILAGTGVLLGGVLVAVLLTTATHNNPVAAGATMPGISPATANLLALSPTSSSGRAAADFHLTDQRGHPVSLGQFRGQAVVLSFNDDRCTDVCTLLAEDVIRADQYLGPVGRRHVVFLSVNVNPFYPGVASVRQWSDSNDLGHLANWYFGTGPVPDLEAIWKHYGVYVSADRPTQNVTHETVIELIGPDGTLRAAADFGQNAVDVDPYAHGLAQAAIDLLPGPERTSVAGPQASSGRGVGAGVGQDAPAFTLPRLAGGGRTLGLASLRGRPVVLNFWASSCVDCRDELAGFAKVAAEDPKVEFVGVDVADPSPASAQALTGQAGVRYPVVIDSGGRVAAAYRVADLPTTVYVDPSGRVAVYHPGTMTAEQLRYTLAQFFPASTPGPS